MATIAEFSLPPRVLPLGALFDVYPETTIEIERVVPTGRDLRPYFWVDGAPGPEVCASLETIRGVDRLLLVDTLDDRSLFRCDCTFDDELLGAIVDSDITLLSATGSQREWTFHVRGDKQATITSFVDRCRTLDITPTLLEIREATGETNETELTEPQREALVVAFERGYFDDPRTTTLEEVATEIGISRQALSRRLRRAYRALIQSFVLGR